MYDYLLTHPDLFPAVIGITHTQFVTLLDKFSPHLYWAQYHRAHAKPRLRQPGGGRKTTLKDDGAKLFWILFYYKVYPTFRLAQALFRLDKRNLQLWLRFLEPVLWHTLGYQLHLPVVKARHLGQLLQICPDLKEFIIDCTERSIQRPQDTQAQHRYYSGKQKRHTVKNQLLVHPRNKKILAISPTVEGKRHDKKIMEEDLLFSYCPPGSTGMGDLGYQGIDTPYPRLKMVIPLKKPPGRELAPEEKATNRVISSVRVRVEHPISYLKHFNILSHRFRNRLLHAHQPFLTLTCLYNFTRTHR